jgi:cytochrome d ubiquinol oxidase subunit I
MNVVGLAQSQFAITTVYHFFFVPLTLGLSIIVAIMETLYVVKKDEVYKKMTKFWGKLFLINYAVGVVTGLVMEFQFGMNWSEYSRFVGDIFGAPLAIEGITAFFLEATFIGLWAFGWDKLPKAVHAATIWLTALGATISALWILIANSFMHFPVGYTMVDGRPIMSDFGALVFNPHVWTQFPHTVFSGYVTGAFFVMGISIYHILKKTNVDLFQKSFKLATVFALVSIVGVILIGHQQAQLMVEQQPMKMAAAEALWNSENPASLSLLTISDEKTGESSVDIRIPYALSLLSYSKMTGEVTGINELQEQLTAKYGPGDYIPSVFMNYWSFRIMIGAGFLMAFLAALGLFIWVRLRFKLKSKWWYLLTAAISLPYLANTTGWLLTELGRQPWVVYGLLKTADAVSPTVTAGMVLTSLIVFTLLYGVLIVVDVYLLVKFAKSGPEVVEPPVTGVLVNAAKAEG